MYKTLLNQNFSTGFTQGALLTGQANWETQSNVAAQGNAITAGGIVENGTTFDSGAGYFTAASYDDTTLEVYNLARTDFKLTTIFQRNDAISINATCPDYIQLVLGSLNVDGLGTARCVTAGIDFGATGHTLGGGVQALPNFVCVSIYDSVITEYDFEGLSAPAASWNATHSFLWQRIAGANTITIDGVSVGTIGPLDNNQITLPQLAIYSLSGYSSSPKTGMLSLKMELDLPTPSSGTFTVVGIPVSIDTNPGTFQTRSVNYQGARMYSIQNNDTDPAAFLQIMNNTTGGLTNLDTGGNFDIVSLGGVTISGTQVQMLGFGPGITNDDFSAPGLVLIQNGSGAGYDGGSWTDNTNSKYVSGINVIGNGTNGKICSLIYGTARVGAQADTFQVYASTPATDGSGVASFSATWAPFGTSSTPHQICGLADLQGNALVCNATQNGGLTLMSATGNYIIGQYVVSGIAAPFTSITAVADAGTGWLFQAMTQGSGSTNNKLVTLLYTFPAQLVAVAKSGADIVVTWDSVTGATVYMVSKDGGAYATHTSPFTDTGAASAGHTYTVRAFAATGDILAQGAGNYSLPSGVGKGFSPQIIYMLLDSQELPQM